LAELQRRHGALPPSLAVHTGSGGSHYWFAHPGRHVHNSAGRLGPGIDVRGDGGYVIAPPSVHHTGRAYQWATRNPIAPLPEWVLESAPAPTRVLAGGFRMLLLDEPSSGRRRRDPAVRADHHVDRRRAGVGILLVEHDMTLVMAVCENLFVLDFGRCIFSGTAAETQSSPVVRAAYLATLRSSSRYRASGLERSRPAVRAAAGHL
jgi:hypothetical protein